MTGPEKQISLTGVISWPWRARSNSISENFPRPSYPRAKPEPLLQLRRVSIIGAAGPFFASSPAKKLFLRVTFCNIHAFER